MSKVLLLDSEAERLKALDGSLRGAGIELLKAACAVSCVELARSEQPELIVVMENAAILGAVEMLQLKAVVSELSNTAVAVVSTDSSRKTECFRLGCDEFIELPCDEPEILFRICAVLRRAQRGLLSGSLAEVSLVDIVQMLLAARKSGCLSISIKNETGALSFEEGQVVDAVLGTLSGEEAFLQILRRTRKGGTFSFGGSLPVALKKTINKRTDHLLLGLASVMDEERDI